MIVTATRDAARVALCSLLTAHRPQVCEDSAAYKRNLHRFEINNTFDSVRAGRLNVNLVQILEHLAPRPKEMRAYLLRLQRAEAEQLLRVTDQAAKKSARLKALGNMAHHALCRGVSEASTSVSPLQMLLAGFDPVKEPFLKQSLGRYEDDGLKSLREAKVRIPQSYNLPGIADPTGSLPPNCVCAVIEGVTIGESLVAHGSTATDNGKRVLIYR